MSFEETKAVLERELRSERLKVYFGKRVLDDIHRLVSLMLRDVTNLMADKQVSVDDKTIEDLNRVLDAMIDVVSIIPLDERVTDFCQNFARLAYNWNQNLRRDRSIERKTRVLDRLLRQHLTIVEATNVLRRLTRRLERFLDYSPPAFRLARHFLESVFEEQQPP